MKRENISIVVSSEERGIISSILLDAFENIDDLANWIEGNVFNDEIISVREI